MKPDYRSLLGYAFTGMACLNAFLILYFADKGLGLSDGAMYFNDLVFEEESNPTRKGNVWMAFLFHAFDPGIVFYRVLRLALTLVAALGLGYEAVRWTSFNKKPSLRDYLLVLPLIAVSALASFAIYPRTLSYNSLGLILSLGIAALALRAIRTKQSVWMGAGGILVGLQIFNKFPSGIFMMLLLSAYTLLAAEKSKKQYLSFISGIFLTFIVFELWIEPLAQWMRELTFAMRADQTHPIQETIGVYFKVIQRFTSESFANGWYVMLALVLSITAFTFRSAEWTEKHRWLAYLPATALLIWIVKEELYVSGFEHMNGASYLMVFFMITAPTHLVYFLMKHRPEARTRYGLILMYVMPWAISIGTNTNIISHQLQYVVWWTLLHLVLSEMSNDSVSHMFRNMLAVCVCAFGVQTAIGHTLHPYRLEAPLTQQHLQLTLPHGEQLLVDTGTYQLAEQLNAMLQPLQLSPEHTCAIALYKSPWLNLLSGLPPAGSSWFARENLAINTHRIAQLSPSVTSIILAKSEGDAFDPQWMRVLAAQGFKWKSFKPLGTLKTAESAVELTVYFGKKTDVN